MSQEVQSGMSFQSLMRSTRAHSSSCGSAVCRGIWMVTQILDCHLSMKDHTTRGLRILPPDDVRSRASPRLRSPKISEYTLFLLVLSTKFMAPWQQETLLQNVNALLFKYRESFSLAIAQKRFVNATYLFRLILFYSFDSLLSVRAPVTIANDASFH